MNYEQVNKVKPLAQPVMQVLEGLDRKCHLCDNGIQRLSELPNFSAPDTQCVWCKGTTKLKWYKDRGGTKYSWTPQPGEWYLDFSLDKSDPTLWLVDRDDAIIYWAKHQNDKGEEGRACREALEGQVPILPWETIEEVLEKAGYSIDVDKYNETGKIYEVELDTKLQHLLSTRASTRQEAVMEAVIELGKDK